MLKIQRNLINRLTGCCRLTLSSGRTTASHCTALQWYPLAAHKAHVQNTAVTGLYTSEAAPQELPLQCCHPYPTQRPGHLPPPSATLPCEAEWQHSLGLHPKGLEDLGSNCLLKFCKHAPKAVFKQ